jgi:hypothetical protein
LPCPLRSDTGSTCVELPGRPPRHLLLPPVDEETTWRHRLAPRSPLAPSHPFPFSLPGSLSPSYLPVTCKAPPWPPLSTAVPRLSGLLRARPDLRRAALFLPACGIEPPRLETPPVSPILPQVTEAPPRRFTVARPSPPPPSRHRAQGEPPLISPCSAPFPAAGERLWPASRARLWAWPGQQARFDLPSRAY